MKSSKPKAEAHLREVVSRREQKLGPSHPDTLAAPWIPICFRSAWDFFLGRAGSNCFGLASAGSAYRSFMMSKESEFDLV